MPGPRGMETVLIIVRFCISNKRKTAANPQAASALPVVRRPEGQTTFHFYGTKALMVHRSWTVIQNPKFCIIFLSELPNLHCPPSSLHTYIFKKWITVPLTC